MQYIQNTINRAEVEKLENNHKGMDAEGRQGIIIDMSKGICMHGHHIWKVGTSLIHRPSGCEVIPVQAH